MNTNDLEPLGTKEFQSKEINLHFMDPQYISLVVALIVLKSLDLSFLSASRLVF